METEKAERMFEIHIEDLTHWKRRMHKHNFFEIVYVEQGSGYQCINTHEFEYQKDNIFLLPPLDCHSFKISEPSRFYFLRFTDHFFHTVDGLPYYQTWFDKIAYILANYNRVPGDIIGSEREREFIINNIKMAHSENLHRDGYSESVIAGILSSILNILARSIEKKYVDQVAAIDNRLGEIIRFINTNINDGKKLKIPYLASEFGISPTYFSEYFKKNSGTSLAQHILKSKLYIAETKLLHTDQSLKEIAYDLNFTDSSHLSRSFKKFYGMTISEFKNKQGKVCR